MNEGTKAIREKLSAYLKKTCQIEIERKKSLKTKIFFVVDESY